MADDFPKLSRADHARSRELVQLDHDQWLDRLAPFLPTLLALLCLVRLLVPGPTHGISWEGLGAMAVLAAGLTGWMGWWLLQQDENPHLVMMAGCLPLLSLHNAGDVLAVLAVLWGMLSATPVLAAIGGTLSMVLHPSFVLLLLFPALGVGRAGALRFCLWLLGGLLLWAALLLAWKDARDVWLLIQKADPLSPHGVGTGLSLLLSGLGGVIYVRLRRRDLMDAYPAMALIPPIMLVQAIGLLAGGHLRHAGWMLSAPALAIVWDMVWPLLPLRYVPHGRMLCYILLLSAIIYSLTVR